MSEYDENEYEEDEYAGVDFEKASEEEAPELEQEDDFSNLKHSKFQQKKQLKEQEKEQQRLQKAQEKILKIQEREREKQYKLQLKEIEKMEKQAKQPKTKKANISYAIEEIDTGDDGLFSEDGTQILGREKMILLKKVSQFKQLFPEKLKSFKIKKNPSVEDLKLYLQEMESIIEVSNIDGFVYDSIIQSIKVIEGVSSYTKLYNVQGLADMLNMNPEFKNLMSLLFIKYHVFSAVPIEYQLVMIVSTTAFICRQKNLSKGQINDFLNQKI